MRDGRVLNRKHSPAGQSGTAAVESIFAMVFIIVLLLGVVQVAFVLYARNVVAASAHEGARAIVERGSRSDDAASVALAALPAASSMICESAWTFRERTPGR